MWALLRLDIRTNLQGNGLRLCKPPTGRGLVVKCLGAGSLLKYDILQHSAKVWMKANVGLALIAYRPTEASLPVHAQSS
jgi:hypothetical protein